MYFSATLGQRQLDIFPWVSSGVFLDLATIQYGRKYLHGFQSKFGHILLTCLFKSGIICSYMLNHAVRWETAENGSNLWKLVQLYCSYMPKMHVFHIFVTDLVNLTMMLIWYSLSMSLARGFVFVWFFQRI